MEHANPIASSTPSYKFRPLPTFPDKDKQLFHFKQNACIGENRPRPKSPVKSAPPVSRVFSHRNCVSEKPLAVSFRAANNDTTDSVLCSKFYNSNSSDLYFEQCFVIEKKLGEGSFGEVMQVKSRDSNQRYAVKRSRKKFRNDSDRRRNLDEVRKHEKLPLHPNCVRFIKAWEERQRLYIQTELCSMSLHCYLQKYHNIPIFFIWKYLIDLLHGLQHIHSFGFVHFDVKPANIFLGEDGSCKIGDFGLVLDCINDKAEDAREGDNKYMAPELLNGVFSAKADVFSLGIAILEMCCDLDLPCSGLSWQLLRSGYLPYECSILIPEQLRSIIVWMMAPDCDQRPTVIEILNHPVVYWHEKRIRASVNFYWWICEHFETLYTTVANVMQNLLSSFSILKKTSDLKGSKKNPGIKSWDQSSFLIDNNVLDQTGQKCSEKENVFHKDAKYNAGSVLCTTPSCERSRPTPRSSSPIARHEKLISQRSPSVSPLSRNKDVPWSQKKISDNIMHGFDYFVSDGSDINQSDDDDNAIHQFFLSQPRNLIDVLNEASCSDES